MNFIIVRKIEVVARIVALLAVPLVVAWFGWSIQSEVSDKTLRREYVQIAVTVLSNPLKSPDNDPLKEWALELLAANAPIKLPESALSQLRTGPLQVTRTETVLVKVPIPIPCGPLKIKRPKFPIDDMKESMDLTQKIALLLADQLVREQYIGELEAVLVACRGSLNIPALPDGTPAPFKDR